MRTEWYLEQVYFENVFHHLPSFCHGTKVILFFRRLWVMVHFMYICIGSKKIRHSELCYIYPQSCNEKKWNDEDNESRDWEYEEYGKIYCDPDYEKAVDIGNKMGLLLGEKWSENVSPHFFLSFPFLFFVFVFVWLFLLEASWNGNWLY